MRIVWYHFQPNSFIIGQFLTNVSVEMMVALEMVKEQKINISFQLYLRGLPHTCLHCPSASLGLVYHPPPFHTRSVLIKGTVREYRKTRNTYRASKKYSNLYHIVILSASTENAALFWYSEASRTHIFFVSFSVCLECYSGCSVLYPSCLHIVKSVRGWSALYPFWYGNRSVC
jgi:hypothetical protein